MAQASLLRIIFHVCDAVIYVVHGNAWENIRLMIESSINKNIYAAIPRLHSAKRVLGVS